MKTKADLQRFMEMHVFAVWDFMCLLKTMKLLSYEEPYPTVWTEPSISYDTMRLINEIIVGEETDELPNGGYTSHLNLYLMAMEEVGADTSTFRKFMRTLDSDDIPEPARKFVATTFSFIDTGKLHVVVSAFTYGRELLIPSMFTSLLDSLELDAPLFRYYLDRHIHLDGEDHGPKSALLIKEVTGDDTTKMLEAEVAKQNALAARTELWKALGL